jgi:5'-methylthioadenosine phosphorylase
MSRAQVGIIGGSGLYQMPELTGIEEVSVETPFGDPSDRFVLGAIEGTRVAFLPRHGRGHRLMPMELPFRANIYAMKLLGVERIISASAVGSLKEEYAPLDILIPDQFFDRTRARAGESTFFGNGIVAHTTFADPVCPELGNFLERACRATGVKTHRGGTYICMEGPAFSTRAESEVYRSWGMDVIGMTNLQEAKLAREAEICYSTLALVTDYDCWHQGHTAVSVETVIENLNKNVQNAQGIIREALRSINGAQRACGCSSAMKHAIFTPPELWPAETAKRLEALIGRYSKNTGE